MTPEIEGDRAPPARDEEAREASPLGPLELTLAREHRVREDGAGGEPLWRRG